MNAVSYIEKRAKLQTALARRKKPRTFTAAEHVMDAVRERIFMDGRPYKVIAAAANISPSTVANIAYSNTTWPRHTTLFPLMVALGIHMKMEDD